RRRRPAGPASAGSRSSWVCPPMAEVAGRGNGEEANPGAGQGRYSGDAGTDERQPDRREGGPLALLHADSHAPLPVKRALQDDRGRTGACQACFTSPAAATGRQLAGRRSAAWRRVGADVLLAVGEGPYGRTMGPRGPERRARTRARRGIRRWPVYLMLTYFSRRICATPRPAAFSASKLASTMSGLPHR